jgi:hypothetical protein
VRSPPVCLRATDVYHSTGMWLNDCGEYEESARFVFTLTGECSTCAWLRAVRAKIKTDNLCAAFGNVNMSVVSGKILETILTTKSAPP